MEVSVVYEGEEVEGILEPLRFVFYYSPEGGAYAPPEDEFFIEECYTESGKKVPLDMFDDDFLDRVTEWCREQE